MQEKEKIRQSGSKIECLLSGDGTLYDEPPSVIAKLIRDKLDAISRDGREATVVVSIPDYHNFGDDGGIKDVFFVTQPGSFGSIHWETTTVLGSDSETMHGVRTPDIQTHLARTIQDLEEKGNVVRHVIPITDSHSFGPLASGIGGFDGLKDLVVCFHRR